MTSGECNGARDGGCAAAGVGSGTAGVLPDAWLGVEVSGLSDAGLRSRLRQVGHARSQLAAVEAAALSEIARRDGEAAAAHTAAHVLSVSGRAARSDVKNAAALGSLDATRKGLVSGAVPAGHANMIVRAAGDAPIDEKFLAERAQIEGHDDFRRTVTRHVSDCSGDDGASLLERQRRQREACVFTSTKTGMTVLNGRFDPITGARIAAAVNAATARLLRDEDPDARLTPAQRAADAVAKLLCEPDAARPAGTSLMLVADYDTVNQQIANARLANGTPVPISEIAKIAVDAGVLPAIFDKATGELRMGRRRRSATELQRSALTVRDQGCVGCGAAPELCRAHHIVEWQHGGHTDLDNLVSVCHRCHHHNIHHNGFTVQHNPDTGRYQLLPPTKPQPAASPPAERPDARGPQQPDTPSPANTPPANSSSAKPAPIVAASAAGNQPPAKQPSSRRTSRTDGPQPTPVPPRALQPEPRLHELGADRS
ncbi:HNH endonuclease [Candidatus Poriferisodalis sp.]|uniref:HNH endonuclease n=1 Tax=Candidatus Poriferisodalis sp. TaxID=3101277 RepID=UPI003B026EFB